MINFLKNIIYLTVLISSIGLDLNAEVVFEKSLDGQNLEIGNMLTWSTGSEMNSSMFIIEKSEDGITFYNVGTVEAAGNSMALIQYNYLDIMAQNSSTSYRLKQIDFDGTFSFTEVISVEREFKNDFMVANLSSVTVTEDFKVTIDALSEGELDYNLSTFTGEVLFEDQMLVVNGLNDLSIDLSAQPEGFYKVNLHMEGEKETLVIKRITDEIVKKQNVASKNNTSGSRN